MALHPLRFWMLERGVTQAEVAEAAGIHQAYLSQILLGARTPSRALARRLAKQTGKAVSIDKILSYKVPPDALQRKRPRGRQMARPDNGDVPPPVDQAKLH